MRKISSLVLLCVLLTTIASVAFSQADALTTAINQLADRLAFANVGYVRSVSDDTIYIDLGQDSGICEGMRFEVVRLGEPILSEGVMIGHQEEITGEIAITRVREQMSLASITKKTKEIDEGDKVYQLTKQIERIAITEFPYGERFNNLSKDIEDRFYTAMIQRGMQIVERERLTEILAEQAMEWTGLFDLSSAAELGRLLGVEGVLIGSLTDQGETLAIRARLVDVETAQSITAAASSINKTPTIMAALSSGIRSKPSVVWQEEQAEQLPEGRFVFSDEFHVQPDERWDLTDGDWTMTNGWFTAMKMGRKTLYKATIDLDRLSSYKIEVDVDLGKAALNYRCNAVIVVRDTVSDDHTLTFWLGGRNHKVEGDVGIWIDTYWVPGEPIGADCPVHVKIEVAGSLVTAYVNNEKAIDIYDFNYKEGEAVKVGLGTYYPDYDGEVRTVFDNFRISVAP